MEGKNGAGVRKHIGHAPIASRHAGQIQRFFTADFNPYLNYHRPCGFATIELSDNGKRRRRYRLNDYRTPYEKLVSLQDWESCLKEGVSAARLQQQALRMSDTECALRMQQRKRKLLAACRARRSQKDQGHSEENNSTHRRTLGEEVGRSQSALSAPLPSCSP